VRNGTVPYPPYLATYSCFTADRYFKAQCVVTVSNADYSGQNDVLRKLALSKFVYNQIDDSAYAGKTVSEYPADNSAMFTANGKDVTWSEFYSGTISNHKIIATSWTNNIMTNPFKNYIAGHLSSQDSDYIGKFDFDFIAPLSYYKLTCLNGFYAAAFQDEKGNIIIAYRGTDDLETLGPDTLSDLAIRYNLMPSQLLSAKLFYDYIKSKYSSAAIQVTGHSLGGALADYVSMLYNIPSISFNSLTGLITGNTYLNQMDYITAFNGSDSDGWQFKRFLNSDDSDYAQNFFVLPLSKYTNNYIMQGNGYTNSIFSYSHMLQSMMDYNNGTFSIINGINLTPANQPWKQGNLFLAQAALI